MAAIKLDQDPLPCCERPLVFQRMLYCPPFRDARGRVHHHDVNRRRCETCKRQWFVPCPTCGWTRKLG